MTSIHPPLLKPGDGVRIIAPSRSLALPWITADIRALAQRRLEDLGLRVSFGDHLDYADAFASTSVAHRLADLHDAFADPAVHLVLTVIGGFNANQLLTGIDYDLIARHPKRLCGFSDITALSNAIHARTGLVTWSGPHFFNFGQKLGFEYTLDHFVRCHFAAAPIDLAPSPRWIDGAWARNQDQPDFLANAGWKVVSAGLGGGVAEGTIIGGNLCTLQLLHGTSYLPQQHENIVLFIEDDSLSDAPNFDRDLQSLLHQPFARRIRALVIGRFEKASGITAEMLRAIIATKRELRGIPIIADVDFGHTTPLITFPIGGHARVVCGAEPAIRITPG